MLGLAIEAQKEIDESVRNKFIIKYSVRKEGDYNMSLMMRG